MAKNTKEHLKFVIPLHMKIDVESGKAYEFYCWHFELYGVKTKLESEGCKVLSA